MRLDCYDLLQMPGPRGACELVAEHLLAGRSVLLFCGPWIEPEIVKQTVLSNIRLREHAWITVPVKPGKNSKVIVEVMEKSSCNIHDSCILLPEDADWTDSELSKSWYAAMEIWAKDAQGFRSKGSSLPPIFLCHRGNSMVTPPPGNVSLVVEQINRRISLLDIRQYIRRFMDGEDRLRMEWGEFILPALAGTDIEAIEYLWEDCFYSFSSVFNRLVELAKNRKWDSIKAESVDSEFASEMEGLTLWSHETGLRCNAAILAATQDRAAVERWFWRGQVELLLPKIDEVRFFICSKFAELLEPGWELEYAPPSGRELDLVKQNYLNCQLGQLELVAQTAPLNVQIKYDLVALAYRARLIRNELAHGHPVMFEAYQNLVSIASRDSFRPWVLS